jgi:thioredoxin 1
MRSSKLQGRVDWLALLAYHPARFRVNLQENRMASENVKEFNQQNFEQEVLLSPQPVLVDFWAEWCGPCRMLAPTIEKLATAYAGKVKVGKVDTDSNRDLALKYDINSIPTVILFRQGQVAQKFIGLRNERDYRAALDAAI